MLTSATRSGLLAAGSGLLFAACYAEPFGAEDLDLPVLAVLDGDGLRLQAGDAELDGALEPAAEWDRPLADHVLSYEFVDDRGEVLRAGVVPDPRHVRSEWDDGDGMRGREDMDSAGAAGIWLPQVPGEVRIYEDLKTDGEPFATAALSPGADPDGIGRVTQPLASISDLRRTPRRIYGSLPHGQGIDILFVPDGFRQGELDEFRRAAEEMMVDMFAEKPEFI